jgi:hypothetical protein
LIRWRIDLIVREIGIDQGAGASRPGGHAVSAFFEPLQRLGVAERHGRFQVGTALQFGQIQDGINQTRPAPHW